MSFEDYADLAGTGFQGGTGGEKVAPEEEFFHSVYVAGKSRKNHINVVEESGKLQVRGVQYNLDELCMIITHTKEVLCNVKNEKGNETVTCFSFKDGAPPWYGTSKLPDGVSPRPCPNTSAERALVDFCNPCRAQIIVAGIYCKSDGTPILTEEKKPIFVFIRGKGMRYSNVSNYLNDCFMEEYPALFNPATEQSKDFEKRVVNNKRAVTKITKGSEKSGYGGEVNVFVLEKGNMIPNDAVMRILELSKKTVDKFNEKFDWSKGKLTSSYSGRPKAPEGVMTIDEKMESSQPAPQDNENDSSAGEASEKTFSFSDINF